MLYANCSQTFRLLKNGVQIKSGTPKHCCTKNRQTSFRIGQLHHFISHVYNPLGWRIFCFQFWIDGLAQFVGGNYDSWWSWRAHLFLYIFFLGILWILSTMHRHSWYEAWKLSCSLATWHSALLGRVTDLPRHQSMQSILKSQPACTVRTWFKQTQWQQQTTDLERTKKTQLCNHERCPWSSVLPHCMSGLHWLFRDVCMFACILLLTLDRLVYACFMYWFWCSFLFWIVKCFQPV